MLFLAHPIRNGNFDFEASTVHGIFFRKQNNYITKLMVKVQLQFKLIPLLVNIKVNYSIKRSYTEPNVV